MKFANFFKKTSKLELVGLFLIIMVASYFRIKNIYNSAVFFGDSGRDILVAKHMVEYNEFGLIAPNANSGKGILKNTPVYYWLISLLWFLTGSEYGLIFLFSFLGILTVFFSYLFSKEFTSGLSSLILPLFMAFSSKFIYFSRWVWQPNLLPLFQIISMLFLLKGLKRNYKDLFFSLQFAFLAFFIHLSYLPILLVTIIIIFYFLFSEKKYKFLLNFILLTFLNLILYLYLSRAPILGSGFLSRSLFIDSSYSSRFIANFFTNINELFLALIPNGINSFLSCLLFLILLVLLFFVKDKKSEIRTVLLVMFFSFFFLSFYFKELYFYYLIPYYLLIFMAVSYLLSLIRYKFISILLGLLILILISSENSYLLSTRKISEMDVNKSLASAIYKDSENLENVLIVVCLNKESYCRNGDSFTSSIWFFLEEISDKKLGYIANIRNGNNYVPYSTSKKNLETFYVCKYGLERCLRDLEFDMNEVSFLANINETYLFKK